MGGQVAGGRLRAVEQQRPLVQCGTTWRHSLGRTGLVGSHELCTTCYQALVRN